MVIDQYNADHDRQAGEMTVKVTGYQWMWRYEYVGEGVNFISRLDRNSDAPAPEQGQHPGRDRRARHYLRDVDKPLVLPGRHPRSAS